MLQAHRSVHECLVILRNAAGISAKIMLLSALAVIICSSFSAPMQAQIGTIQLNGNVYNCPPAQPPNFTGWYYYQNGGTTTPTNCQDATISCTNTQAIGVTFGYLNPVGIVPNVTQARGVIVLFNGGDGTSPGNFDFAGYYFTAGYEIVETQWALPSWEQAYSPFQQGAYGNIQAAACRPASLLYYVYKKIFPSVQNLNSTAGMCAHGESAGSAAIAYSLAYYQAGNWLDNVELISGPVLSDIKQGCEVPRPLQAQWPVVCGQTNYFGAQYGCSLGPNGTTWSLSPTYVLGAQTGVGYWTNDSSCAGSTNTTTTSNQHWLAQSIVDDAAQTGYGEIPTFNYPSTAMSGWLCRSVASGGGAPNNSSPQGQIFYQNIGVNNSPPNYAVYAVDKCGDAEGVRSGNVPGYQYAIFGGTVQGSNAITDDMVGYTNGNQVIPAQCVHRQH